MKRLRLVPYLSLLGLASVLSGCPIGIQDEFLTHKNWQNFIIEFSAAPGATEITVDSDNQGCVGGPGAKKGCVLFDTGEDGTVNFILNKNQLGLTCETATKADWVITKIQLSSDGDPATEKGVFGGRQPGWLKRAFTKVNLKNGLLYENTGPSASNLVTIVDLNNHTSKDTKIIYYQITASNCEDEPDTIEIDPMVQNKG